MSATTAPPALVGDAPAERRADRRAHLVTVLVVAGLHVVAATLLFAGHALAGVTLGAATFAYTRGLLHALDADHLCMIDGSTRKLLGEGHNPRGVGLAFSLGHSSVVLAAGVAVVVGAGWVRTAIDPDSGLASTLGTIGGSVSALYLLSVAAANLVLLVRVLRSGRAATGHTHPTGWWARVLQAPLSRVRHAGHVYLFGLLFGLGFDTASTIAVLMLTTAAALTSGASVITLLGLPLAFAAAMSLGDSINADIMLRVYSTANTRALRTLNIALLVVSIVSALAVAGVTLTALVSGWAGLQVTEVDTTTWGWALAGLAALGGLWLVWQRRHPR